MKILVVFTSVIATTAFCQNALAQKFDPAPFASYFTPILDTKIEYDDNIYTTEFNKVSATKLYLIPEIRFLYEDGVNRYGADYKLTSISYSDSGQYVKSTAPFELGDSDDDAVDHEFTLYADNEFTSRHRTSVNFSYDMLHEERGSDLTESAPSVINEPITYDLLNARLYYQFGGRQAKMRLGGGYQYNQKEYTNFEDQTKYSDNDSNKFFFDVEYQLGEISFLTFDVSTKDVNYKNIRDGGVSSNNTDNQVLLGVAWRGVSKLKGSAKIGYQNKDYDQNTEQREDFDGGNLDVRVAWTPIQRAVFSLDLNNAAEDTNNTFDGNYIIKLGGTVGWFHQWTDKIDTNLRLGYENAEYFGSPIDREDKITNFGFDVSYGFTRWLKMSTGYKYSTTDSNQFNVSNDQNILFLSLIVGL